MASACYLARPSFCAVIGTCNYSFNYPTRNTGGQQPHASMVTSDRYCLPRHERA